MRRGAIALSLLALFASTASASGAKTFVAEVWADNWFELYVNGKRVGGDSVPFSTERSFNSERFTFTASYPMRLGVIAKDYVADASGLEYIGTSRQQIGDGGIIFQIRSVETGDIVATSNATWRIFVINRAPLNPQCATSSTPSTSCNSMTSKSPKGWNTSQFDSNSWAKASIFSPEQVGVKEGYFDISWSPKAKLIWSEDLRLDNTILISKLIRG
jgi:hypothetical protein